MVRKEIYSPLQTYILCMSKTNSGRDIFILAGAMLKVMCILKEQHLVDFTDSL